MNWEEFIGCAPSSSLQVQSRILPAYRELARVLAPWRYHSHGGLLP
ncbi:type VI immunity family protein [Stigmatella aurantiaca]